jgi:CRP-like cAMP-binding protein
VNSVIYPTFSNHLGEVGDYFYIIKSGVFSVIVSDEQTRETRVIKELETGSCFGEVALLYNTPRTATVRAEVASVVYQLARDTFRMTIARSALDKDAMIFEALCKVPLLSSQSFRQLRKLADIAEIIPYTKGKRSLPFLL